uniref:Uncharacterized protein n=1 Tax=Rhizophora mucronata TaxID=61149 RepID=A0A2P2P9D8_RHIMU
MANSGKSEYIFIYQYHLIKKIVQFIAWKLHKLMYKLCKKYRHMYNQ